MLTLAERIVKRKLSVRETEAAVKREKNNKAKVKSEKEEDTVSVDYNAELENKITSMTGRRVKIVSGRGRKVLQIEFADNGDLEELLEKLCGTKIEM